MGHPILHHIKAGNSLPLKPMGTWRANDHLFDQASIWALQAAWAAGRPLLIQGEPGCGKSQLARAVAQAQRWVFIPAVIHHRSECTDLQWHFDAVARLGAAQLLHAKKAYGRDDAGQAQAETSDEPQPTPHRVADALEASRFLAPGPLWWAVNWTDAKRQFESCDSGVKSAQPIVAHLKEAGTDDEKTVIELPEETTGRVLLIDEIDKANVDLPNGLLEVLDNGAFSLPYAKSGYVASDGQAPLVIITTNRERALPPAFLRRCFVYTIEVPDETEAAFCAWLLARAGAHFGKTPGYDPAVAAIAAGQLWTFRQEAKIQHHTKPGLGEFLDLMRALTALAPEPARQRKKLNEIARFAFDKSQQVLT